MNWRTLARAVVNPRVRSELLTRLSYGRQHFQGETTTLPDRFPVLFRQCTALLAGVAHPRILSFGCSTGEEAFTLARYLPDAEIVGVDLNAWCVREASRHNRSAKVSFLHRNSPEFNTLTDFDAIFCMAVFQRAEHREAPILQIETGFTFDLFERELADLDARLKVGGFLFLDHCDFAFTDTALATRYEAVTFPHSQRTRDRPLFGRDNRLLRAQYTTERCFRKARA